MTLTLRNRWWAVCAALWLALILYASTDSAEAQCDDALNRIEQALFPDDSPATAEIAPDRFWIKKAIHVGLFTVFALLLARSVKGTAAAMRLFVVCAAAAAGTASEAVQLLYPAREPSLRDVLLNTGSAAVAALLLVRSAGTGSRQRAACRIPADLRRMS